MTVYRKCIIKFLLVMYIILQDVNCAPPRESTTEVSQPLTTVQYYVKRPTTKQYEYDEYYDNIPGKHPYDPSIPSLKSPTFTPPDLIMTVMKTILNVIRTVNNKRDIKNKRVALRNRPINGTHTNETQTSRTETNGTQTDGIQTNETQTNRTQTNGTLSDRIDLGNSTTKSSNDSSKARGMGEIYYDDLHDHYFHHHDEPPPPPPTTTTVAPMKPRYSDPWAGYYDFIITEGSFKFWTAFQLFTAGLLLYSALAAIYYAKFNPIQPDYDTTYDDYFFGRSLEDNAPQPSPTSASAAPGWISSIAGMGTQAFQRIMDTVNSEKYKEK